MFVSLKMGKILNFNIGVLGHVDCGKTTLARCLSTIASTAAFDKNPQSKERGITLDLGFSCFKLPAPEAISSEVSEVQLTLVDCPGHASLIRTIIAGAQIIDAMMLVIDVTKGIQTQTSECLVIGEILCDRIIVILNKVDLLPKEKSKAMIDKMTKRLNAVFQGTKFSSPKIIAVAAKPGGSVDMASDSEHEPIGIRELLDAIKDMIYIPQRSREGPFLFSVDHCFSIRGQGTVMTGTVLQGKIAVNDSVEIPSLGVEKKVKSMQMFHKPVNQAFQGDRLGICVTQFDPKLLERGLVCTPGLIQTAFGLLIKVTKIPYYDLSIDTKAKFHISVGNETVMAKATFFGCETPLASETFNSEIDYHYQDSLLDIKKLEEDSSYRPTHQYAVLQFEKSVPVIPNSLIIGSKLDLDVNTKKCRLAFRGTTLRIFHSKDFVDSQLPSIKVFKKKFKEGTVERRHSDNEVIVKDLLKKGTNLQLFIGLKVELSTGEVGEIEGHFGTSGKLKIYVPNGLKEETLSRLKASEGKKKGKGKTDIGEGVANLTIQKTEPIKVLMSFKKYIFAKGKKMSQ